MRAFQLQIFLLMFSIPLCMGNRVPQHRKVRQIRPQDVVTISEERMAQMTPEMKHVLNTEYIREFFKPLNQRIPLSLKYLLDKRSFLREPPYSHLISDIPEITEMDFDQNVRQKKGIHFQLYLHELEEKKKKGKQLDNEGDDKDEYLK